LWSTKYGVIFLRALVGKRLIKYTKVKKASTQNSLEGKLVLIVSISFLEYIDVFVQQYQFIGMYKDMLSDEKFHIQLKKFKTL